MHSLKTPANNANNANIQSPVVSNVSVVSGVSRKREMAIARKRRYRERVEAGVIVVPLELPADLVDGLVLAGILPEMKVFDRKAVAAAILDVLEVVERNASRRQMMKQAMIRS